MLSHKTLDLHHGHCACVNLMCSRYGTDKSSLQFRLGKSLAMYPMIISCKISKLLTSMYNTPVKRLGSRTWHNHWI